ncbi:hypothetical protein BDV96DRAFT_47697 [Lophiotrema nucula]|uniref:Secreted protein n=1 Tax=Lophiotrema nucula TaxID=690887 RepID=A0A6A5Z9Z2_9PLEO|nr:hypothetical protein BDV96DRAFT_47697 [Lophiotrema nucula]
MRGRRAEGRIAFLLFIPHGVARNWAQQRNVTAALHAVGRCRSASPSRRAPPNHHGSPGPFLLQPTAVFCVQGSLPIFFAFRVGTGVPTEKGSAVD